MAILSIQFIAQGIQDVHISEEMVIHAEDGSKVST
jgi:hypothetical protein